MHSLLHAHDAAQAMLHPTRTHKPVPQSLPRALRPPAPIAPLAPTPAPYNANARAPPPARRGGPPALHGLARDILSQPGIEGDPLAFLEVTEAFWRALRNQKHEPSRKGPAVVRTAEGPLHPNGQPPPPSPSAANGQPSRYHDYDVIIAGGTLGLFLATALQLRGWRVAIVEKRLVAGRNQEWNISWGELEVLTELGLLTPEQLRSCVVSEFNPIRVGFKGGEDMWTQDVLNLGVLPRRLIELLRERFAAAGGVIHENTAFKGAVVHEDGLRLSLAPGGRASPLAPGDTNRPNGLAPAASATPAAPRSMTCRLLLDCMGHYSDIVKQIRGRAKPDGMCLVVGGCAEGFPAAANQSADLLYSLTHARHDMQLFWEAFPAEGGSARTTYMFAYSDAHPERPSFEELLDTYFELLPQYQGLPLEQLRFKRVLFGGFPCYANGPLPPAFDRVMQIGDASAAQSPLSFGGFGCMMRHLPRLASGLDQALSEDRLTQGSLSWLQPYQPSLAASWLFQRSMSIAVGQAAYPPGYPHAPPYAADYDTAAENERRAAGAQEPVLVLGAGAGPGAAFQEAMAASARGAAARSMDEDEVATGAAARFAAGAADPVDYLWQGEGEADGAAAAAAVSSSSTRRGSSSVAAAGPGGAVFHERDFRSGPAWARLPHEHVNAILGTNFRVMGLLGDRVLRPFLQDTIQLLPLSLSMTGMMLADPVTISRVLLQVGPRTLVPWFGHYAALAAYSVAYALLAPLRPVISAYAFQRLLDALQYGSGSDYRYHAPPPSGAKAVAGPASATAAVAAPAREGELAAARRRPQAAVAAAAAVPLVAAVAAASVGPLGSGDLDGPAAEQQQQPAVAAADLVGGRRSG